MVVLQVIARMNLGGTSKYILKLSNELEAIGIKSPIATGYVQGGEIEDPNLKKIKPIRIKHLGRKISPILGVIIWAIGLRYLVYGPTIIP